MAVDVLPIDILSFTRESLAASATGVALFEAEQLNLWTKEGISSVSVLLETGLRRVEKGFGWVKD